MSPTVKALENSMRRSKSTFFDVLFYPLGLTAIITAPPEAPPAAPVDSFLCTMPPFDTSVFSTPRY